METCSSWGLGFRGPGPWMSPSHLIPGSGCHFYGLFCLVPKFTLKKGGDFRSNLHSNSSELKGKQAGVLTGWWGRAKNQAGKAWGDCPFLHGLHPPLCPSLETHSWPRGLRVGWWQCQGAGPSVWARKAHVERGAVLQSQCCDNLCVCFPE